jgi:YVTN family beta-propeller protein
VADTSSPFCGNQEEDLVNSQIKSLLLGLVLITIAPAQWLETTIHLPDSSRPQALVWNATGNKLYCAGGGSDSLYVINGATNTVQMQVPVGHNPSGLAWNATQNWIYCANQGDNTITVLDGASSVIIATIPVGQSPRDLLWVAALDRLYAANRNDTLVTVIDGASNTVLTSVRTGIGPQALVWDDARGKLYCGSGDGVMTVIDGVSSHMDTSFIAGEHVEGMVMNPANDHIYVIGRDEPIGIVDLTTYETVKELTVGVSAHAALNTQNNRLYVAGNPQISVVDCAMDSVIRELYPTQILNGPVLWNSMNNKVYCTAGAFDHWVIVLDCAADSLLESLAVGAAPVAIAWNRTDNRIYTANRDSSSISVIKDNLGVAEGRRSLYAARRSALNCTPNPVHGVLSVSCAPGVAAQAIVRLYSILGRKLIESSAGRGALTIAGLPAGIYLLQLEGDNYREERQIVIVK